MSASRRVTPYRVAGRTLAAGPTPSRAEAPGQLHQARLSSVDPMLKTSSVTSLAAASKFARAMSSVKTKIHGLLAVFTKDQRGLT